jgi:hypothetical protein
MAEDGRSQVEVAVALVTDQNHHVLLLFNDHWGTFALPMTKRRRGRLDNEAMARAAIRAGTEALGVPVRRVEGDHKRLSTLVQSGRQLVDKQYLYEIFHIEPHPDFADRLQIRQPHLWLSPHLALSGAYGAGSSSCAVIRIGVRPCRRSGGSHRTRPSPRTWQ